jgi:glyoxylase-like metal-dependent hydrolase (beta-lactamase superfamily II)
MTAPTSRRPKQEQEPASDEIVEVAPGVLRLQLPIAAFTGLGHVNCYALLDDRGAALVDPGFPGKDAFRALEGRLRAAEIPLARVHTVVVTHSHPDHFGAAGITAERAGAAIVAATGFRTWWDDEADVVEDPAEHARAAVHAEHDDGLAPPPPPSKNKTPFGRPTPWGGTTLRPPLSRRVAFRARAVIGSRWFSAPKVDRRLADGEGIELAGRTWLAMHTPGHTEDHLCLWDPDEGVLLSGDHVLPTITPHLSGMIPGDPLHEFEQSLRKVERLGAVGVTLPAHGHPFDDLAGRAAAIRAHHVERLAKLSALVDEHGPATVQDLSDLLFGPHGRDPLAQSETYAHLEHLRLAGSLTRDRDRADGALQYRSAGE